MVAALEATTRSITEAVSTISRGGSVAPGAAANTISVDDTEVAYILTHAAYAAPAIRKELEYHPFDLSKIKGGKVCIPWLTTGCHAGAQCPNFHTKKERVCV